MTEQTARIALPFLQPGQAQKELFHNEALARIDLALQAGAQTLGENRPPASPTVGECWIIGPTPSSAWLGHAGALAGWTTGGWRFVPPIAGMTVWIANLGHWAWHDGEVWRADGLPVAGVTVAGAQVVGARQPAIADASGGLNVDAEARATISAILAALRTHGLVAS